MSIKKNDALAFSSWLQIKKQSFIDIVLVLPNSAKA